MDAQSLSIVIGPCIFYETLADVFPNNLMDISKVPNFCVQLMIENYDKIFEANLSK
jgi:hypothetical protein